MVRHIECRIVDLYTLRGHALLVPHLGDLFRLALLDADICIEQRKAEEVTEMWYKERMAPEGVKVYNPAFDVTDHELIAGIVTEYGVARAPYTESLKEIMERKAQRG